MVITLADADFSANNIGRVPSAELDSTTKALLQFYTRFDNESEIAWKLNDWVLALKDANLWNRITALYMPWISSNLTQAKTNYITKVAGVETNMSFANGALSATENGGKITLSEGINAINFHCLIRKGVAFSSPRINGVDGDSKRIVLQTPGGTSLKPVVQKLSNSSAQSGYYIPSGTTFDSGTMLWEIGGLSALEQNALVNGVAPSVGSSYDQSTEPLGTKLTEYIPTSGVNTPNSCIFFSGDGNSITAAQRTVILDACNTLRTYLINADNA